MNKFDIHVLLAGFSEQQTKQLTTILKPLPINLHNCDIHTPVESLPKVHVILIGMENIGDVTIDASIEDIEIKDAKVEETEFDISSVLQETATDSENSSDESQDDLSVLDQFVQQLKSASPYGFSYLLAPAENILSLSEQQQEQYRDFIVFPVNEMFLKKRLERIIQDLQDKFVQLVKKRRLKNNLEKSDVESLQLKGSLNKSLESTRDSNKQLIRLLSNQVFARMGQRASGRNQQLNLLLVEIAKACDCTEAEIQDLTNAWHMRNIGKMSFSDKILNTPYIKLSVIEQRVFNFHPTLSHAAMMIVRPLDKASRIVLQHKEYLDGTGYPQGLEANQISKLAQILTVMNDYTELVAGRYSDRALSTVEAFAFLENYASEKYNDDIVKLLLKILPELSKTGQGMYDLRVPSNSLEAGMQLTRDLISDQGILLLSEGLVLDKEAITRLHEMESNLQEQFKIFVKQK